MTRYCYVIISFAALSITYLLFLRDALNIYDS